jgi:glycosyltransferase involved in cell wall biosynthesis
VVISANNCRNIVHFRGALLNALRDAGYRTAALAPLDDHADELRNRGVEVLEVPIIRSGLNPLEELRLLFAYVRLLRRLRPAACFGFTIKPNIFCGLAARLCGVPFVANVTGLGTAFLARGILWGLVGRLYRLSLRRAKTVFFHNAEDLQAFVDTKLVLPGQAKVIPGSGVDLKRFTPGCRAGLGGSNPVFLFVGRLIRDKGVREFVEAARSLRIALPNARFQLLGNLDPQNRTSITASELRSWIQEEIIEHFSEREDVRPLMREATAVVLPSYREGLSRALLEASAMAKPLVGTDVAGVRELVIEGVTGTICKPRDAESLASALERVAAMPRERLNELGANARLMVERAYEETLVSRAYLAVLAEVAGRPGIPS